VYRVVWFLFVRLANLLAGAVMLAVIRLIFIPETVCGMRAASRAPQDVGDLALRPRADG
jgi:hypothetical protein